MKRVLIFLFWIFMAASGAATRLVACSSSPPVAPGLSYLDDKTRRIYLAYYPDLTIEQRAMLLRGEDYATFENSSLERKFFHTARGGGREFTAKRENYAVASVDIQVATDLPIQGEGPYVLKAVANWADGRKVDVTLDSTWLVQPPTLAAVQGPSLTVGCANGTIRLNADFLGERNGVREIPVKKKVERVDVEIAGPSLAGVEDDLVRFIATASCYDGTTSDVSCEANWNAGPELKRESRGCGYFKVIDAKRFSENPPAKVTATYGGITVAHTFLVPQRRPAGGFRKR